MKRREIWIKISIRPNMVLEMRGFSHLVRAFTEEKRKEAGREEKKYRFGN